MYNPLEDIRVQRWAWIVAAGVVLYATWLALSHATQPLLDLHSFRQAQTALSAYWLGKQGFALAYETPVAGHPWSIPFEFPLFQWLVAVLSQATGVSLTAAGRLLSFGFLLLCIFPVHSIGRRLQLPPLVTALFCIFTFSMPVYVYWARAFMIETAALFFILLAAKYFIDYLLSGRSGWALLLFTVCATLSVLQKTTTALPVLLLLSLVFVLVELTATHSLVKLLGSGRTYLAGASVVLPVAVGYAWVVFTDRVKQQNPFGQYLTSQALSEWNWGTLMQRVSADLWVDVLLLRMVLVNLGGLVGALLLVLPFFVRTAGPRARCLIFASGVLGIAPLVLFTNLHIVHDYYQTANLVFLAYALAVATAMWLLPRWGIRVTTCVLALILASNYYHLNARYLPHLEEEFDKGNRELAIGSILARELPEHDQFVAFGNDWSSTFSYFSGRKGYSVRNKYQHRDEVAREPERFVEPGRLGAVVACVGFGPALPELFAWAGASGRNWRVAETHGCLLATPEHPFHVEITEVRSCAGELRVTERQTRQGFRYLDVTGWVAVGEAQAAAEASVMLEWRTSSGQVLHTQAVRIPRLDASRHLGWSTDIDLGFSRLFPLDALPGDPDSLSVIVAQGAAHTACRFNGG